jgi:hypothetical protein
MGPLFVLDFPKTAAHANFKKSAKGSRCCLTLASSA